MKHSSLLFTYGLLDSPKRFQTQRTRARAELTPASGTAAHAKDQRPKDEGAFDFTEPRRVIKTNPFV
jgi:hypothetical protein